MSLLSLNGVSRTYAMRRGWLGRATAVQAVDDISLSVQAGRTLGVVGESGCGKSTTGRLALGLEMPDTGSVHFAGAPMPRTDTPEWRRLRARLQLVPQDPLGALDRRLTVARQIAEPLTIHGIGTAAERSDRVATLLNDVGLRPDQAARYPHALSGGQRQRVVLARALAASPDLLVCDEPVSALDVSIQAQIVNLLADLQAERQIALMFISHDLRVVRQISHEVAVMYLGRVIERGDPDAVFTDPAHPYARALVGAIPGGHRGKRQVLQGDPPNPADRPTGCAFHPRCPLAVARCRAEVPALKPRPGDGRLVACHVAQDEAERRVVRAQPHPSPLPQGAGATSKIVSITS
jgi:peptide/nickel transport system ATP-binding protein